jgi:hypothetical protein
VPGSISERPCLPYCSHRACTSRVSERAGAVEEVPSTRPHPLLVKGAGAALLICLIIGMILLTPPRPPLTEPNLRQGLAAQQGGKTLVVYVYHEASEMVKENFEVFRTVSLRSSRFFAL